MAGSRVEVPPLTVETYPSPPERTGTWPAWLDSGSASWALTCTVQKRRQAASKVIFITRPFCRPVMVTYVVLRLAARVFAEPHASSIERVEGTAVLPLHTR